MAVVLPSSIYNSLGYIRIISCRTTCHPDWLGENQISFQFLLCHFRGRCLCFFKVSSSHIRTGNSKHPMKSLPQKACVSCDASMIAPKSGTKDIGVLPPAPVDPAALTAPLPLALRHGSRPGTWERSCRRRRREVMSRLDSNP